MPKKQLLSCGLLTKYPTKSSVFNKLVAGKPNVRYTKREKMHIVALYWTPELPKTWIEYQFRQAGASRLIMKRLRRIAYDPRYRGRWEHLGPKNVEFIGPKEVEIFYNRRDLTKRIYHPYWAVPVIIDEIKRGLKIAEICEKYKIHRRSLETLRKRNIFTEVFRPWHKENTPWQNYRLTKRSS